MFSRPAAGIFVVQSGGGRPPCGTAEARAAFRGKPHDGHSEERAVCKRPGFGKRPHPQAIHRALRSRPADSRTGRGVRGGHSPRPVTTHAPTDRDMSDRSTMRTVRSPGAKRRFRTCGVHPPRSFPRRPAGKPCRRRVPVRLRRQAGRTPHGNGKRAFPRGKARLRKPCGLPHYFVSSARAALALSTAGPSVTFWKAAIA